MIMDPREFEIDYDWGEAGFEFVCWLNKHERTYVITNDKVSLVMYDRGNGHCRFVECYHPEKDKVLAATYQLEDMIDTLASELKQDYELYSPAEDAYDLFYQVRHYINQYDQPIYKIFTLNIREDTKWPTREMFGWYHTEDKAREAVACNACDMQDHAFNYALISRSYQGGYGLRDEELAWFKWNRDKQVWETCERPETCKNLMFV